MEDIQLGNDQRQCSMFRSSFLLY